MKIPSRRDGMRRSSDASVREALEACCVSCADAPSGACGGTPGPASTLLADPGSLDPVGPLDAGVQARLTRIAGLPATPHHRVRVLTDGTESYGAMMDLLLAARTAVRFENFIFRDDTVGQAFAEALEGVAADGVDVRVLYDPFGSIMSRRPFIARRLRRSAVLAKSYNPLRPTPSFVRGGRDHRKLVVQDERRLVAGGMCLADVWSGNCIRHCTWRDSAVLIEGPAAQHAADAFDDAWGVPHSAGERMPVGGASEAGSWAAPPLDEPAGGIPVRILPGSRGDRLFERILMEVVRAANREILITNPYFLPTPALYEAIRAAGRAVRVEVVLPARNNHRVTGFATESLLGPLLEAGVRVWLWTGPMIHAKTVVVDRRWSAIGSSNLDSLSLRKNLELDVEIHGTAVGEELARIFRRDRAACRPFTADEWRSRNPLRRTASRWALLGRRFL